MGQRSEMYRMRPIFELPEKIDLPTCMYSTRNPLNSVTNEEKCETRSEILKIIEDKKPLTKLVELEERWERVIDQVKDLIDQVNSIKKELNQFPPCISEDYETKFHPTAFDCLKILNGAVISANPSSPPYSLLLINQLCKNFLAFTTHTHSTVSSLPENLKSLGQCSNSESATNITFIWKEGVLDCELTLNPIKQIPIRGEVNVLRHAGRIGLEFLGYPSNDPYKTVQLDTILDICHRLQHNQTSKKISSYCKTLSSKLGKSPYFGGEKFNICDIAVWSVLKQLGASRELTPNMSKWYDKMDDMLKN